MGEEHQHETELGQLLEGKADGKVVLPPDDQARPHQRGAV